MWNVANRTAAVRLVTVKELCSVCLSNYLLLEYIYALAAGETS